MAAFGMRDTHVDNLSSEKSSAYRGSASWHSETSNLSDWRAVGKTSSPVPPEFGSSFELCDSSHSQSSMSQFERNMQFQMKMLLQIMDRFLQCMEAMLRAQMGGQSGSGDVPSSGVNGGDNGGTKPVNDGGTKPVNDGGTKPVNDGGTKPVNDGGTKPVNDGGTKPVSDGGSKPVRGGDSGPTVDDGTPRYADTGVQRGKTIYRDDFNGSAGQHPNSNVFDTQHIGPDGLTRQRGTEIDENAIISDNNTVMDGNGHLQLFADKQKTLDPKTGEYVDYTKGSFNTGKDAATNEQGLTFNLKDYPNGLVIETRAKHPTNPGTKFDALWIMTDTWAADPAKGEKKKDTIEYDAAEGGGAGITVHYPVKDSSGKSTSIFGGGKRENLEDGKFHTYTVSISHSGDVVEYIDGKQAFAQKDVFPTDKDLHLRASLEVSPKWTGKKYTGDGGLNSDGAGIIDYLDVSELKP